MSDSGSAAAVRPSIPPARYAARLGRAREVAKAQGVDALLIGVGSDLVYLTGYHAMPLERLTMLVVPANGAAALICPRLEATPALSCAAAAAGLVEVKPWGETDDPIQLVRELVSPTGPGALAISDQLWAMFVLRLMSAIPDRTFIAASGVLRELRITKDPDEIELLQLAARAADRVVMQIASGRLIGRTEADVAREVRERLLAEGHEIAGYAIVGSGPNSASPHHDAGERVIQAGEPIVLDIGGSLGGYWSDITRTLWVTGGDPAKGPTRDFLRLYDILQGAQDEAVHSVRPGIPCEKVDAVGREIISNAGYGELFIHRIGHGIGLEVHEEPYMVSGNEELLREGMAFSVEPGIYVEGRHGARIEDAVVCGPEGPIQLNQVTHDLLIVEG